MNLGESADDWNAMAREYPQAFNTLRRQFIDRLTCVLIGHTSSAEFKILAAIAGRTLRFRKFAEAISMPQFQRGLKRGEDLCVDDRTAEPLFAGCNIRKDETVRNALSGLLSKELITRWPPSQYGHAPVYMPFSQSWLASEVSKDIGVLPLSYPYFHAQLFVEDARANLTAQIIEIADDCVVLTAVNRSSFSACGELFTVPTNEFLGRFTRLPPSEKKPARR